MSNTQHTPGPWYADTNGGIWRRKPSDLYENGGGVAGDRKLATVWKGWVNEGEIGYPLEANARLIAAAPDLLESIQEVIAANASEGKAPGGFSLQGPTKDHQRRVLLAWQKVHAAIAKATGEGGMNLDHYTHRRHADAIKAWADGAKIQYKCRVTGQWKDCGHNNPRWNPLIEYRVKPAS